MDIRQLEAFAAVMSSGSVTGAARLLERSQPAVTRLVQELEAEVGYPLFTRSGPRVTPTERGFLLYEEAERALASLRHIRQRAEDIGRGTPRPLLLAATTALAVGLLPEALRTFEAEHGPAAVQLRSASPEQVMHAVLEGTVQLGLSSLPLEHRGLQLHWIGELPCVAVLPQESPLARQQLLRLEDLAASRLITLSNPYRLRQRLESLLGAAVQAAPLIETNSSMNAQALARAGLGVALLDPLTALGAPLAGVVQRPLDIRIPFFFGAVTPQAREPAAAVHALIASTLSAAQALPGFIQHPVEQHARLLQEQQPPSPPSQ